MGAGVDGFADLGEMQIHRRGIAPRHDQPRALAFGGADGTEYVSPLGALVVRCAGPGSLAHPTSSDLVLLPDPRLVLPPQLYFSASRETGPDFLHLGGEVFLKSSIANSFWA